MVAEDDELLKDKEIDKLMALISLSFKKIYKPINKNLKTSSNTSRANQDNTPRINRGTGYDNQRVVNVAGARENVGTPLVQQSRIQCYNCKEYGHRDDTDDELEDQELEANYLYMAQIQEDDDDLAKEHLKKFQAELDRYHDVNYASKVEIDCAKAKGDLMSYKMESKNFAKPEFLKKAQRANPRLYDTGCYNDNVALMLAPESDETIHLAKERLCFLNFFNDLRIIREQRIAAYKGYRGGGVPLSPILHCLLILLQLVEIILFIVDSGCSKHMMGNLKLLTNFVEKFMGTMKFGNDQITSILGYGDLVQGKINIKRVYYVEGLNQNLFSVGQFCDTDLEIAFRKSTCYIRDLKGNDLFTGSRGSDLYFITLQETSTPNPICLMAKATSSQAWLWHRRLSHLNFDTINLISKNDIVIGLPKLKFIKDHLCSSCELGKAKQKSFYTKTTPISKRRLQLLHKDLCGLMRVDSINGKKYVLLIVDDYSRYTWTHFLRSKDETPEVLIDFLRLVLRGLHAQVRTVRTDKGMECLNKTLHSYFATEGIRNETFVARTLKQNGVVKRRNRTLVEAARTMLSAS
ncbi:retrovirus-related pol polyprotein from transposon TNT 1-94 [Tanacetum coccineum]